jgi:hypothetical protein
VGMLHEMYMMNRQYEIHGIDKETFHVIHNNALDSSSKNVKKTADNRFIILEKTEEGSDSDKRNLLYEGLAWKIANGFGRHGNAGWFHEHYKLNKELIDWYHSRAEKYYNG